MGMNVFKASSSGGSVAENPNNVNPKNFEILRVFSYRGYTLAEIRWPETKSYEGRKILLYRCTKSMLTTASSLDPHFDENGGPLVPLARFEPTERGWGLGRVAMEALDPP